jgi:hypothetical protein
MIVLMKKYLDHRFAAVISFAACMAMVVAAGGCVAGSSTKVNIADVPGQTPGQTTPISVEPTKFDRGKETYRIYSAILDHKWNNGSIVVRGRTDRGGGADGEERRPGGPEDRSAGVGGRLLATLGSGRRGAIGIGHV